MTCVHHNFILILVGGITPILLNTLLLENTSDNFLQKILEDREISLVIQINK